MADSDMDGDVEISGWASYSRAVYYTHPWMKPARGIPLGVFAEVTIGNCQVVGLVARSRLHPEEMSNIGIVIRRALRDPFRCLADELSCIIDVALPGEALSKMSERFCDALSIEAPKKNAKKAWNHPGLIEAARKEMAMVRDREFHRMLRESCQTTSDELAFAVPCEDIAISRRIER